MAEDKIPREEKEKKNKNKKKAKDDFEDDGRVYADMSVLDDVKTPFALFSSGVKKQKQKLDPDGYSIEEQDNTIELTKKEKKAIIRGVIKAHLLFALIVVAVIVLIFLLIMFVWLK